MFRQDKSLIVSSFRLVPFVPRTLLRFDTTTRPLPPQNAVNSCAINLTKSSGLPKFPIIYPLFCISLDINFTPMVLCYIRTSSNNVVPIIYELQTYIMGQNRNANRFRLSHGYPSSLTTILKRGFIHDAYIR